MTEAGSTATSEAGNVYRLPDREGEIARLTAERDVALAENRGWLEHYRRLDETPEMQARAFFEWSFLVVSPLVLAACWAIVNFSMRVGAVSSVLLLVGKLVHGMWRRWP